MSGPIVILAGGTGGHVFPGLAVAEALRERGEPVLWIGARGRMEAQLVPARGIALELIDIGALRGRRLTNLLAAPLQLLRAVWQAAAVLRRHRARAVVSFGGFAAGPGGLAAWLLRLPLLVHEQNSRPGLTNRTLARFARRVLTAFPGAFAPSRRVQLVGNPVRAEIASLPEPSVRLAEHAGALRVLVLGGSQGARALNRGVPEALAGTAAELDIRHQCGRGQEAATELAYREAGVGARVVPFIEDMAATWGWADLVVCRAGALTLAEICAAGVPSVLVPLPSAADNHQHFNAEYLVAAGAASNVAEGADFPQRLVRAIARLVDSSELRLQQAEAARALARPDATARVVEAILAEVRA